MPASHQNTPAACALLAMLLVAGCEPAAQSSPGLDLAAVRKQFVLADEPTGVQTVLDLYEQQGGFEEGDVVLVGSVGGMPNPWQETEADFPWRDSEAAFFLVDPSTAAEFEGHEHAAGEDHSDCVYCQKRAADSAASIAAVTFNGPDGKTLTVGAQQLFGLKVKDTVVVTGHAQRLGEGLMVVEATGIYIRR